MRAISRTTRTTVISKHSQKSRRDPRTPRPPSSLPWRSWPPWRSWRASGSRQCAGTELPPRCDAGLRAPPNSFAELFVVAGDEVPAAGLGEFGERDVVVGGGVHL